MDFDTAKPYIFKSTIALGVLIALWLFNPFYVVDEGHVGIVKRWGKAIEQQDPGLHALLPIADEWEPLEVRTRKNVEKHPASTSEEMPVTATVSVNWTVTKSEALNLYIKYGSLRQFEVRVLDPRLRSATKDAIAKFTSEELIGNRQKAIALATEQLIHEMDNFPVSLDSLQIENIELPKQYLKSIQDKQTAKNLADAEAHKLQQQKLQSQQHVNTASAAADALRLQADAEAYSREKAGTAEATYIKSIGDAEAAAFQVKLQALGGSDAVVSYEWIKKWSGKLPTTSLGSDANMLMQVPQPQLQSK